ncbi:hypothetical protein, partial [Shewanella xiamenensis]|uniref:hypothetical protein n=1 Tax=Shewanella xiamenensis TaxID=332186 RepID=UPI0021BF8F33
MAGETYRLAYHQMFKEANCDREDWINKDAHQYFLTDKKFKNIVPNLHYVPDFLLKTYFTCQNGHRFQPAWSRFQIISATFMERCRRGSQLLKVVRS